MNLVSQTITTALTNVISPIAVCESGPPSRLTCQANFTYGSGGTTVSAYLQTSFDGGLTWTDIANFSFTTSSARKLANFSGLTPVTTFATLAAGAITANTAIDGAVGDRFRVQLSSTGTYAGGTTFAIDLLWTVPAN